MRIIHMDEPTINTLLGNLHADVTRKLSAMVNSEDCVAADMNSAIKFLKDNDITAPILEAKAKGDEDDVESTEKEKKSVLRALARLPYPVADEEASEVCL